MGALRRDSHVASERHRQADANGVSVNGGNNGFAPGERDGHFRASVAGKQRGSLSATVTGSQVFRPGAYVSACAEGAAGSRDHDCSYRSVGGGSVESI